MSLRPDLAKRNVNNSIHGMTNTSTFTIWAKMKARCLNKNNKDFPRYGGRGIKICDSWLEFNNFYKDMGARPDGMQLDRIDNNGNYNKENCRWATPSQNSNNKGNNHKIVFDGKTLTIAEWARSLNICPKTLRYRIVSNWTLDLALSSIVTSKRRIKK